MSKTRLLSLIAIAILATGSMPAFAQRGSGGGGAGCARRPAGREKPDSRDKGVARHRRKSGVTAARNISKTVGFFG
ncbi:hypothetical protein [Cupriavidus lacunae]|uniref:hypothetical protein n=1 Tax=Cupriavidus lacunae TaxID=2666307 RepID=UPI001058D3B4|nr:hypothetical protein [Cupriavidus lacunae]